MPSIITRGAISARGMGFAANVKKADPFNGFNAPTTALSSSNGTAWTGLYAIAAGPANKFIAVGFDQVGVTGGLYIKSSDGVNWSAPTYYGNSIVEIRSVSVNSAGVYVLGARNSGSNPAFSYSSDGVTFSAFSEAVGASSQTSPPCIIATPSGGFVSSFQGYAKVSKSSNGSTWSPYINLSSSYAFFYLASTVKSIACNANGLLVGVGTASTSSRGGSNYYAVTTSSDGGSTWSLLNPITTSIQGSLNVVCASSNGGFIAAGKDNGTGAPTVSTSTDGYSWTTPVLLNSSWTQAWYPVSIACNSAGTAIVIGDGPNVVPYYSVSTNNGQSWSVPAAIGGTANQMYVMDIAVTNTGKFVVCFSAVGTKNSSICMSY